MDMSKKYFTEVLTQSKAIDVKNRIIDVVMTTVSKDREGDIIEPGGLNFVDFLKNPVVLWAHKMDQPPIAKVLSIQVSDLDVQGRVQFADTPFALEIFKLYSDGFLKGWSIGFIPKEFEIITDEDSQRTLGFHITKALVLELSGVPVPSNPIALSKRLQEMVTKGILSEDPVMQEMVQKFIAPDPDTPWDKICKTHLPPNAFAKQEDRKYPHHCLRKGEKDGLVHHSLELHKEGLAKAWDESQEDEAPIRSHLNVHRNTLGLTEHVELYCDMNKRVWTRISDGDAAWEHCRAPGFSISFRAFKKSLQERGGPGKIPISIEFSSSQKAGGGFAIFFEPIQTKEHEITEARISRIELKLTELAEPPSKKDGREEQDGQKDVPNQEPQGHFMAEDIQCAEADLLSLGVDLLTLFNEE